MITSYRTETITRRFDSADSAECRTETENRYIFQGSGRLSISAGCVDFADHYGSDNRSHVGLWFDNGEVGDAVESWLAALHHGATVERNEESRARCVETLRRFAGVMGLSYDAPALKSEG